MPDYELEEMFYGVARHEIARLAFPYDDSVVHPAVFLALQESEALEPFVLSRENEVNELEERPVYRFGPLLVVRNTVYLEDLVLPGEDGQEGLVVPVGREYLGVHVPPDRFRKPLETDRRFREAYPKVARLLLAPEAANVDAVIGLTHARVAQMGKVQHYNVVPLEVPPDVLKLAEFLYDTFLKAMNKDAPMDGLHLVWHSRKTFLDNMMTGETWDIRAAFKPKIEPKSGSEKIEE